MSEKRYLLTYDEICQLHMLQIVRCRDCRHFNDEYEPAECRMTGLDVAGYDFCSQGERREP